MTRAVQDLPLKGLGVAEECALISFVYRDLEHNPIVITSHWPRLDDTITTVRQSVLPPVA